MLVLSRKVNEQILINGNIIITLVHSKEGKARIGIDAPIEIPILRKELLDEDDDPTTVPRSYPIDA